MNWGTTKWSKCIKMELNCPFPPSITDNTHNNYSFGPARTALNGKADL